MHCVCVCVCVCVLCVVYVREEVQRTKGEKEKAVPTAGPMADKAKFTPTRKRRIAENLSCRRGIVVYQDSPTPNKKREEQEQWQIHHHKLEPCLHAAEEKYVNTHSRKAETKSVCMHTNRQDRSKPKK